MIFSLFLVVSSFIVICLGVRFVALLQLILCHFSPSIASASFSLWHYTYVRPVTLNWGQFTYLPQGKYAPQQVIIWLKMSIVQKFRNPVLDFFTLSVSSIFFPKILPLFVSMPHSKYFFTNLPSSLLSSSSALSSLLLNSSIHFSISD